jgi:hypothetical protein
MRQARAQPGAHPTVMPDIEPLELVELSDAFRNRLKPVGGKIERSELTKAPDALGPVGQCLVLRADGTQLRDTADFARDRSQTAAVRVFESRQVSNSFRSG